MVYKSKETNYGTRLWPFLHSYAIRYGSHAPHFVLSFMLILVGFAPKCELWQQVVMPISTALPGCGRRAPHLFGPFMLFLPRIMAIAMITMIAMPTKWVTGPGISQPILYSVEYWRGFQCPAGILPGLSMYPTPKLEVA